MRDVQHSSAPTRGRAKGRCCGPSSDLQPEEVVLPCAPAQTSWGWYSGMWLLWRASASMYYIPEKTHTPNISLKTFAKTSCCTGCAIFSLYCYLKGNKELFSH